jgi:hypothetical protein
MMILDRKNICIPFLVVVLHCLLVLLVLDSAARALILLACLHHENVDGSLDISMRPTKLSWKQSRREGGGVRGRAKVAHMWSVLEGNAGFVSACERATGTYRTFNCWASLLRKDFHDALHVLKGDSRPAEQADTWDQIGRKNEVCRVTSGGRLEKNEHRLTVLCEPGYGSSGLDEDGCEKHEGRRA